MNEKYLMLGGCLDGQIMSWPRPDNVHPCLFPKPGGPVRTPIDVEVYYPHLLTTGQDRVGYRVATPESYLYPREHADVAYRLLALDLELLATVRVAVDPR